MSQNRRVAWLLGMLATVNVPFYFGLWLFGRPASHNYDLTAYVFGSIAFVYWLGYFAWGHQEEAVGDDSGERDD